MWIAIFTLIDRYACAFALLSATVPTGTSGVFLMQVTSLSSWALGMSSLRDWTVSSCMTFWGFFSGLELSPDGRLYAGDVGFTTPGVRIFDTNAGDLQIGLVPIQGGLRPIDLLYIEPL